MTITLLRQGRGKNIAIAIKFKLYLLWDEIITIFGIKRLNVISALFVSIKSS